ncbi:MAG: uridine kinase [Ruminococcaceae bacterium]|nr:uridine kinase [Oscillospiraceae bacterium]
MAERLVIGIAGGTGSGKTTLTKKIVERFGDDVVIVNHDNYYKSLDHLTYEQRCLVNYDSPDAFDNELFISQLRQLKAGQSVVCPVYDFTVHNRSEQTMVIEPKDVIVVEGILILENPELCELMDLRIFVDTDADVRVLRRIKRDIRDRGRTLESVTQQYLTTVKPMHEKYVDPSRKNAHIIIPEGGKNEPAVHLVLLRVAEHLYGND